MQTMYFVTAPFSSAYTYSYTFAWKIPIIR